MKSRVLSILVIVTALCCGIAQAQVPRKLNYQGFLTTPSGAPINTPQTLIVRIYDAASGGNLLFTETHDPVTVSNGIFNILLGSVDVNTNPLDLKFLAEYYLGITVGTDPEMSPRQPLAASPYAIRAATADSAEALRIGGTVGEVLAGTGAAPAWTSVPTIAGNVVIGATTTQPFPSRLQVVAPTTKTNATLGSRGLSVTSNEASAPFALDVKIFGAPLLANRGVILQSTDWNTADGGNLLLQPQGGNVGVGLGLYTPGSTLTVAGRIESTTGGVKFPDGNTQTKALANCSAEGDVAVMRGGAWVCRSTLRFVDNGDGTVTDHKTGLMWEKKLASSNAACLDPTQANRDVRCEQNLYSWSVAPPFYTEPNGILYSDFLEKLNDVKTPNDGTSTPCFAGYCDWRIPILGELRSILAAPYPTSCANYPCIDAIFGPTQASAHWSSSSLFSIPEQAWTVLFNNGYVVNGSKNSNNYARAVRSGR